MRNINFILILLASINVLSQSINKKLNFIIMIDDELTALNISNEFFTIHDAISNTNDTIPFRYHVGYLDLKDVDYDKLLHVNPNMIVAINFNYKESGEIYRQNSYKYVMQTDWINDEYMILRIYNSYNKKNKKKYYFRKKKYLVQFQIPSKSTLLEMWK